MRKHEPAFSLIRDVFKGIALVFPYSGRNTALFRQTTIVQLAFETVNRVNDKDVILGIADLHSLIANVVLAQSKDLVDEVDLQRLVLAEGADQHLAAANTGVEGRRQDHLATEGFRQRNRIVAVAEEVDVAGKSRGEHIRRDQVVVLRPECHCLPADEDGDAIEAALAEDRREFFEADEIGFARRAHSDSSQCERSTRTGFDWNGIAAAPSRWATGSVRRRWREAMRS